MAARCCYAAQCTCGETAQSPACNDASAAINQYGQLSHLQDGKCLRGRSAPRGVSLTHHGMHSCGNTDGKLHARAGSRENLEIPCRLMRLSHCFVRVTVQTAAQAYRRASRSRSEQLVVLRVTAAAAECHDAEQELARKTNDASERFASADRTSRLFMKSELAIRVARHHIGRPEDRASTE